MREPDCSSLTGRLLLAADIGLKITGYVVDYTACRAPESLVLLENDATVLHGN